MKKYSKILALLILVSILFGCLASCKKNNGEKIGNKEKFTKTFYDYFDTVTTVIGYSETKEEFDRIAKLIETRLSEYHKLYDAYHSAADEGYEKSYAGITNIKDINAVIDGSHVERRVDKKLIDLLIYCKEMYTLTAGETNVAMGSVLKLWHDEREKAGLDYNSAALPSFERLNEAAKHTDINNLIIDEENSTVFISDPEMLIDVGAIAKGYATERIAAELESSGINGYALSVGGNVRAIGAKPNGECWNIGIENPLDPLGSYIETLKIADTSVVTSGSYQRFYTVNGERYHHIIDKDTLYPSAYFISVSIVTKDSAVADALSTAVFSMPFESGISMIEGMAGVEALWVFEDGSKKSSSGFDALKTE
ncbi:MAG: FAD:protein FMN transferase [Ruminococcaceae bacterium]|nr:FAD:protein FMN transferase [Oscillospiraceae bacterium]